MGPVGELLCQARSRIRVLEVINEYRRAARPSTTGFRAPTGRLGSDAAAGNSHSPRSATRRFAAVKLPKASSILDAASTAG